MDANQNTALFVNIAMYIVDIFVVVVPLVSILYISTDKYKPKVHRIYTALAILHILASLFGVMILVARGLDQDRSKYTIIDFVYSALQTAVISTLVIVDLEFIRQLLPIMPASFTRKRILFAQVMIFIVTIISYLGVYAQGLLIFDANEISAGQQYAIIGDALFKILLGLYILFRYFYLRYLLIHLFNDANEHLRLITLRLRKKIRIQLRGQFFIMVSAMILLVLLLVEVLYRNISFWNSLMGKELKSALDISSCIVVVVYTQIMLPILDFGLDKVVERMNAHKNGINLVTSPILRKDRPVLVINHEKESDEPMVDIKESMPADSVEVAKGVVVEDTEKTPTRDDLENDESIHDLPGPRPIFLKIHNDNIETPTTISHKPSTPSANNSTSALSPNGPLKRVQFNPSVTKILD